MKIKVITPHPSERNPNQPPTEPIVVAKLGDWKTTVRVKEERNRTLNKTRSLSETGMPRLSPNAGFIAAVVVEGNHEKWAPQLSLSSITSLVRVIRLIASFAEEAKNESKTGGEHLAAKMLSEV